MQHQDRRMIVLWWWRSSLLLGAIAIASCETIGIRERRDARSRDAIVELYAFSESDSDSASNSDLASSPEGSETPKPDNNLGNIAPVYEPVSGFARSPDLVIDASTISSSNTVPEPTDPALTPVDQLTLVGDTDRDGVVSAKDLANRDRWSWSHGGFVPVNLDDDDRDGQPDALDRQVRGQGDDRDLAIVRLLLPKTISAQARIALYLNPAARPFVNVFQRTAQGWRAIDLTGTTPLIFSRDVVLGVESRAFATGLTPDGNPVRWDGRITIEAIVRDPIRHTTLATDQLQLRVTPWLMSPSLATVETIYVTDIPDTRQFATQLAAIVEPRGVAVVRETIGTLWMQDTMELGYSQTPGGSGFATWQTQPVVLDGVRQSSPGIHAADRFAKTLLSPNFSLLRVTTPRSLPKADYWVDWYGNLEVSPPIPGFPLGRIYYGRSQSSFHPDLIQFLAAQALQTPAVELDTSWLYIRHVDEIISFLPHPAGGQVATIASPQAGLAVLTAWRDRGFGGDSLTLPDGTEITIDRLLADRDWVAHNQAIERDHLATVREQLRSEFGLSDDRIVALPVVFSADGRAIWSNPVNALWVNGAVIVGDPLAGQGVGSAVRSAVIQAIAPLGLTVEFIDDGYYQLRSGNVHCATNTRRSAPAVPFWQLEGVRVFQGNDNTQIQ